MNWLIMTFTLSLGSYVPGKGLPPPPAESPPGLLRVWTSPQLSAVARAWAEAYERQYPDVEVQLHSTGSDTAMAGLYTAEADIALIGRDATSSEQKAFEWVFRYKAEPVPVLRGSMATEGQSPALAVLVHPANPLTEISTTELFRILSWDDQDLSWSDLNVTGSLADQKVEIFMPHAESGTGRYLRDAILGGDILLRWNSITEFADSAAQGALDTAATRSAEAVSARPNAIGIGITSVPGTKSLSIISGEGPAYHPDIATIQSGAYPLSRLANAYINLPPDKGADPKVQSFLEIALSPDGQQIAAEASDYLQLDNDSRQASLSLLGAP
jgi:phosphate transport system substrate-binding protein